jgi:RNA-directed DNA polymerase
MEAACSLTDKGYKAMPLRRTFIEKKGKKEKRPLGMPTMKDRAMQKLHAIALDPVAEATADLRSFGFRKNRCCQDAMAQIFSASATENSAEWALEGDIKGCFDHIGHNWLLENVPMDKTMLKQFLKAGFICQRELFPTEEGTPQGGVISPILANMALDGMEGMLAKRYKGKKANLARHADDFAITANTKETAEAIKEDIREFLAARGLELSDSKTLIAHINDGCDLLGWNFRKYKGKLLIKPSKKAIKPIVSTLSETVLRQGIAMEQGKLAAILNAKLRGWGNCHQAVCAKKTFTRVDFELFRILWKWAKRRHPKKGKRWIANKYWRQEGTRKWVFTDGKTPLAYLADTPIIRHKALKPGMNPCLDTAHYAKRKLDRAKKHLSGGLKVIWTRQGGLCHLCGLPMDVKEDNEIMEANVTKPGGRLDVMNVFVHGHCFSLHQEAARKGDVVV